MGVHGSCKAKTLIRMYDMGELNQYILPTEETKGPRQTGNKINHNDKKKHTPS